MGVIISTSIGSESAGTSVTSETTREELTLLHISS